MARQYFLLASFPALRPDQEARPDIAAFEESCRRWLGPGELAQLYSAGNEWPDKASETGILAEWFAWEGGLRNALARERAIRLREDPARWLRTGPGGSWLAAEYRVADLARIALQAENPLKAEEILLKGRWQKLDELERGHYFDMEQVLVYRIRLRLLVARQAMTPQAGHAAWKAGYEAINGTFPLNLDV